MKSDIDIFSKHEFKFKITDYDTNKIIFDNFVKFENLKKEDEKFIWESKPNSFSGDLGQRKIFIHFYKTRFLRKELLGKFILIFFLIIQLF